MNIFIIVNALPPHIVGGTETQTLETAKRLSKNNDVRIITRGRGGQPRSERLSGVLVERSPSSSFRLPLGVFTFYILSAIFRSKQKPDIILCMGLSNGFKGVLCNWIWGIPIVSAVRSEKEYKENNLLSKWIAGFTVKYSDALWVQSEVIEKEFLVAYPNNKTHVIPNGVEVDGRRAEGNHIIYVGSLNETGRKDKGVRYLLDVSKILDGHKLVIVGEGPSRERLENMAKGLNVEFMGNVPPEKIRDHLINARVFAFPSLYGEGLPNAVLEALSVGLPVVASKTAKLGGIIRDGETGFLVDPKNPEQLAEKIKLLYDDEILWRKISDNCKREARKYSWENTLAQTEDLIRELT